MAGRRVVRKSAVAKPEPKKKVVKSNSRPARGVATPEDVVSDTQIVWSANNDALKLGIDNSKPAKSLSKVASFQISVGNFDRGRSMEDFIAHVQKLLKAVPYGKDGIHASALSSYYIVDGKVCLPGDFDPEKENFSDGKLPPSWAGGPMPSRVKPTAPKEANTSSSAISAKSYDEKYGPEGSPAQRATAKAKEDARRRRIEGPNDDELDDVEIEWDVEDIDDDAGMEEVARASQKKAARKITRNKKVAPSKSIPRIDSGPDRRVVNKAKVAKIAAKKTASASKKPVRVIRRKK